MSQIKQRADYTFKYNRRQNRHGWLRLTPAYSVKLVHELVEQMKLESHRDVFVLDPFSGTATTGLVVAEAGFSAHLFEINPFLIWLGTAKCRCYSDDELCRLQAEVRGLVSDYKRYLQQENWLPTIHNIERWWSPHTLRILSAIRQSIVDKFGEPQANFAGNLIWIAFCRLVIETSAAAFNHVSMSFQDETVSFATQTIDLFFEDILNSILMSASAFGEGTAVILSQDSRYIEANGVQYSHVITSPPYPNRISYIRELRPYMYWTKFLRKAKEAGELDWEAIGGTWGVATSRLKEWRPEMTDLPQSVVAIYQEIEQSDNKNALLMSRYVHKYFHDMHQHLDGLRRVLQPGAQLKYIVGNSTFYGVHVPTQDLLAASLAQLRYQDISHQIVRKRNSKKELFEYCISARYR